MANIKFYKKATRPTNIAEGSIWFDSTHNRIVLCGAAAANDIIYGSKVQDCSADGDSLKITKIDGTTVEIKHSSLLLKGAVGSATQPIYNTTEGLKACSYSLNKTVPADAVFTDTHYKNTFKTQVDGTEVVSFDQAANKSVNFVAGSNITLTAEKNTSGVYTGKITIASSYTNTNYYDKIVASYSTGLKIATITANNTGSSAGLYVPTYVGYTERQASVAGLVPAATSSDASKYLRSDGSWATPTDSHYKFTHAISDGTTTATSFSQDKSKTTKFVGAGAATVKATAEGTDGIGTITITSTDTKVTSEANHYAPTANASSALSASASGATAAWSIDVVKGITLSRDSKGHVTGVSVASGKIPANPNTDTKVTSVGNHYTPTGGTAKNASSGVLSGVTCDAAGHVTSVNSATEVPASLLTGTIDIARLPKGALERLFVVKTETAAMELDIQEGDTVKVTDNSNKMYFCTGDVTATGATFAKCFTEYTAGSATSVPWTGVSGKPSTFAPSAHTHTKSEITDFPTNLSAFENGPGYTTNKGTVTSVTAGEGLTGGPVTTSGTISHYTPTTVASNVTVKSRTYVNSISLDKFGHVTAIGTGSETVTDTHYTNSLAISGGKTASEQTTAVTFAQNANKTLKFIAGSNVSITAADGTITIGSSYTNTNYYNKIVATYSKGVKIADITATGTGSSAAIYAPGAGSGLTYSSTDNVYNLTWDDYE